MKNKEDDNMEWEVLESEYLYKRPWLTARREHVKLPTGAEIQDFYILEYPEFCNVIAITKDGKVVLKKARTLWRLPSESYMRRPDMQEANGLS